MNKFFKILLIVCILAAGLITRAQAYETQKSEIEKFIVSEVAKQTRAQLKHLKNYDIEVKIINLPIGNKVRTNEKPDIKVTSNFDKFMQYDIKRLTIGNTSFPVSVKVAIYKDVLTAKEFIPQLQMVNYSNTYIKRTDIANSVENVMEKLPEPLVAAKNISKDMPVLISQTKEKPDIVRNSEVKIMFVQNDDFNIEISGVAMKEGKIGDIITVKNTRYNKIYTATVTGENRVEVKL